MFAALKLCAFVAARWYCDSPFGLLLCRPTPLLQFLHDARQQLLRAAALVHDTRKLPPLTQLVQPGGVLDIAATHARALQTTADELFGANDSLRWARVQLFNVPDALDVLSTGMSSSTAAAGLVCIFKISSTIHILYVYVSAAESGGPAQLSCTGASSSLGTAWDFRP